VRFSVTLAPLGKEDRHFLGGRDFGIAKPPARHKLACAATCFAYFGGTYDPSFALATPQVHRDMQKLCVQMDSFMRSSKFPIYDDVSENERGLSLMLRLCRRARRLRPSVFCHGPSSGMSASWWLPHSPREDFGACGVSAWCRIEVLDQLQVLDSVATYIQIVLLKPRCSIALPARLEV